MNAEHLLTHFDRLTDAPDAIPRLRRFILDLAVRGKLVEQDPEDEPAEELLEAIEADRCNRARSKRTRRTVAQKKIVREEAPYPIPEIWVWAPLGYLTISRDGERIPVSKEERNGMAKVYDYYGASGVIDKVDNYLFDKPLLLIGEDGANLINRSTPIAFIARGKYWVNNHAHVLDGFSEDFLRYVELFINATDLKSYVTGTAQPKMNQAKMNSIPVALPPLAEQHRIVAKVDELMALCDRLETVRKERETTRDRLATASLARLNAPDPDPAVFQNHAAFALNNLTPLTTRPDQIKALRWTILNLAVRGKLVEQDPEDEPAGELVKQAHDSMSLLVESGEALRMKAMNPLLKTDELFPVPKSWQWVRLGELSKLITKGSSPKWQGIEYVGEESGILFITSENVGNYTLTKMDKPKYVEARFNQIESRSILQKGDILLNLVGASIGRSALFDLECTANINQAVALIRPIHENAHIVSSYLLYYLNSPVCINEMLGSRVINAQPNISLTDTRNFLVPLPPLAEQHRIVAKVDELMTVCDRLEASLARGEETRGRLVEAVLRGVVSREMSDYASG